MLSGRNLKENLINNGFFINNNEINIIDDYNICDITEEATEFFLDNFNDTGCRNINIYYAIPSYREDTRAFIHNLAHSLNIDFNVALAIYSLSKINKRQFNPHAIAAKLAKAGRFISSFHEIGIRVSLKPYYSINLRPPFHGRYWLTGARGFIVDASLNTYGKGKIFAQLMDDENFSIITRFFNDEILNNRRNDRLPIIDAEILNGFANMLEN